jgi:soluble lytic murein transglycosylase-like protein
MVLGCVLLMALGIPAPCAGGTVYFADGRGLTIDDAWVEDDIIYLRLPEGGVIGTSEARVARVILPEVVEPAATEQASRAEQKQILDRLARTVARRYELDEELVSAVVRAESGYDPAAVSRVGAVGLMQLMPGTAAEMEVHDPFDPEQNLDGGVRYLKWMLDRFEGEVDLALAAYNAGPAAVDRYGGIPPYPETRSYVRRVLSWARR